MDNGKPIWEARADLESVISSLEYYGGLAPAIVGYQVQRPGCCPRNIPLYYTTLTLTLAMLQVRLPGGSWGHASREPLGVVGGVGAWNYPLQTCTWKVLGTVLHCTVLYCTYCRWPPPSPAGTPSCTSPRRWPRWSPWCWGRCWPWPGCRRGSTTSCRSHITAY